jgi:hypothetical protein
MESVVAKRIVKRIALLTPSKAFKESVSRASILTALAWKIIQMEQLPYLRLPQGIILYNRDRK